MPGAEAGTVGPRRLAVVLLAMIVGGCSAAPAAPSASPVATAVPTSPPAPPSASSTPAPTLEPTVSVAPTAPPSPMPTVEPTPSPAPTASPSPSPAAVTRITSADGVLSIEIPEGAAPAGVTVSIEARTADQSPAELKQAGVPQAHYALLPSGTQFSKPVRVSETLPRDTFGDPNDVPFLYLATRTDAAEWEWLGDASMTLTADVIVTSGTTSHFSSVLIWSDRTYASVDPRAPRWSKVGTTFTRRVRARSLDPRAHEVNFTEVDFENEDPDIVDVSGAITDAPQTIVTRDWTCLKAGPYGVTFRAKVNSFAADNPFWGRIGLPKVPGQVEIVLNGECVDKDGRVVTHACIGVHHFRFETFLSWLQYIMWMGDADPSDVVEVILSGANDDRAVQLAPGVGGKFEGKFGIDIAGEKTILKVIVHSADGKSIDVTDQVVDLIVRIGVEPPPEESSFGVCKTP